MVRGKIIIEKCCCGEEGCTDYWLKGIGFFVQGSGFAKEEAELIAKLLNKEFEKKEWVDVSKDY